MAIITISRGTFSGGQKIAECVAKKWGYRCVSREILVETSRLYGISEEQLFKAVTDAPVFIEHLHSERKRYLACIKATMMNVAKGGYMVYHGHAGHFLLKNFPQTIKVKVIAGMEFRIRMLLNSRNLSREEAEKYIEKVDEDRIKWTRYLYHVDWNDPALYDLVMNLDNVTISSACAVLSQIVNLDDYKVTAESQKLMEDMAFSSHLEAILAMAKNISGGEDVEIESDDGVVTIKGVVGSIADADRVGMIVSKTPGVKDIISRLEVRLPGLSVAGNNRF